jgi:hypothetical protein
LNRIKKDLNRIKTYIYKELDQTKSIKKINTTIMKETDIKEQQPVEIIEP